MLRICPILTNLVLPSFFNLFKNSNHSTTSWEVVWACEEYEYSHSIHGYVIATPIEKHSPFWMLPLHGYRSSAANFKSGADWMQKMVCWDHFDEECRSLRICRSNERTHIFNGFSGHSSGILGWKFRRTNCNMWRLNQWFRFPFSSSATMAYGYMVCSHTLNDRRFRVGTCNVYRNFSEYWIHLHFYLQFQNAQPSL